MELFLISFRLHAADERSLFHKRAFHSSHLRSPETMSCVTQAPGNVSDGFPPISCEVWESDEVQLMLFCSELRFTLTAPRGESTPGEFFSREYEPNQLALKNQQPIQASHQSALHRSTLGTAVTFERPSGARAFKQRAKQPPPPRLGIITYHYVSNQWSKAPLARVVLCGAPAALTRTPSSSFRPC